MFTSTYPFVNGVQDNGDYLPSNSVTLATILKSNGYQTAAFVSSFVLDRRFGLDQGFNTYDSPEDLEMKSSDPGDIKRPGSEVVRAGTEWLKAHLTERFFLFLHLYDLHTPRSLSAADKARYGDGYDSEIAYVDDQIGKFLKFLAAHRLLDKSLIVFVSDHGESLGEHGENTHGFFIYQSTLHVPFIVHWPTGSLRLPPIINSPASLIDVVPTILGAAGIPIPATLQGTNLLKSGQTSSDIYSESIYPNRHFGTSMLASLRQGHYKYIDAPKPEFFDLAEDPQETNNLYNTKASVASAYRERIKQLRAPYHTSKKERLPLSPEVIQRLHALGYMSGSSPVSDLSSHLADPKDKIGEFEQYGRAVELGAKGSLQEANVLLEAILNRDPGLLDVRLALGLNYQRMGKDIDALEQFRQVLVSDPTSAIAHFDAALSYYNLQKLDVAMQESKAALALSPRYMKAEALLAEILVQQHDYLGASAAFQRILQTSPSDYEAHYGLGVLAALKNDWETGVEHLQKALAVAPNSAEAHNSLGSIYLRTERLESARQEFEEALRLKPDYAWAHYNLALVYRARNERDAARIEFEKALLDDPEFRAAREALNRLEQSQ